MYMLRSLSMVIQLQAPHFDLGLGLMVGSISSRSMGIFITLDMTTLCVTPVGQ